MKKKIFFLILFLSTVIVYGTNSFQLDKDSFNRDQYLTIYKGKNSKLKLNNGDIVKLLDIDSKTIGFCQIIQADDYDSFARIQKPQEYENNKNTELENLNHPNTIEKVEYLVFDNSDKENIRFKINNSRFHITLTKNDSNKHFKVGKKGKLFKDNKVTGIFKILGEDKDKFYLFIMNNAEGINFRKSDSGIIENYFQQIINGTGFVNLSLSNFIMLIIGLVFLYLGIAKDYEPLLLVPIGFGILIGNIPLPLQIFNSISVYMIDPVTNEYVFNTTNNSVMGIIYFGVKSGLLPPLIFLGIGAMTDFSALLARPKSVLLGAAAQVGIFVTFISAIHLGFSPSNAAAIGIIGGADGPTAIFLSSKLAPSLIGPIAIAAYSYMAMVPIIQPPIMKLLTTKKERLIRMKPGRKIHKKEKILFPIAGFILTNFVAPGAIPLLGMLFFGNLLKESGVTTRLAKTASNSLIDIATILLGLAVGASTSAQVFLNSTSIKIFVLGVISFAVATACGLLFAKLMNLVSKEKINPLIGAAGVSAVPDSARVVHSVGLEEDPDNYLLMHAMGPNVAGVIGSAIAAGVFLGIF